MPDAKKLFIAALQAKLKEEGLSQAEVARRAGVTPRCINDILKGRRGGKEETKEKIARVFGMSYDEFLAYGRKILESTPEPFPGFEDVMSLPAKERYFKVWQLAAEHLEITAPPIHNLGDPFFRDRVPKLETKEEVIQVYQEARTYWEGEVKRMEAELRKRGLLPPEEKEITKVEIKKEKKEKSEQKSPSNWSDNSNWSNNLEKTK